MKLVIILSGIFFTGVIVASSPGKNISGTWIIQQADSRINSPVLRISMGEGIWEGRLDMPEQETYNYKVNSIRVDGDSVLIRVYNDGPVIHARLTDANTITGKQTQEGRTDLVELKRK